MKNSELTTGVTLPLTTQEIDRIQNVAARNGGLEKWLRSSVLGLLELDEDREKAAEDQELAPSDYFRPLTPWLISRQLRSIQKDFFDDEARDFEIEDSFSRYVLETLIEIIERGGLSLPSTPLNQN